MRAKALVFAIVLVTGPAQADPWWKDAPKADSAETELDSARQNGSLEAYWKVNKTSPAKARHVVRAAYEVAQTKIRTADATADLWVDRSLDAFASWKKKDAKALGSPEADLAAEFAYRKIDARIEKEWAGVSYVGAIQAVMPQLDEDVKLRTKLIAALDALEADYGSMRWRAIASARSGAVLDIHRVALEHASIANSVPKPVTDAANKAQAVLADPGSSDAEKEKAQSLLVKAGQIQANMQGAWPARASAEIRSVEQSMLQRYARGFASGRALLVGHAAIRHAGIRLARYEMELGRIVMRNALYELQQDASPFIYQPGMFGRSRPGAFYSPRPSVDNPLPPGATLIL